MFLVSPDVCTSVGRRSRRFLFDVFLVRMWLLNALNLLIFPEPVTLKRFLAPLCDFIFGIAIPFYVDPRRATRR